jgi:hypothetical protein
MLVAQDIDFIQQQRERPKSRKALEAMQQPLRRSSEQRERVF